MVLEEEGDEAYFGCCEQRRNRKRIRKCELLFCSVPCLFGPFHHLLSRLSIIPQPTKEFPNPKTCTNTVGLQSTHFFLLQNVRKLQLVVEERVTTIMKRFRDFNESRQILNVS